MIILDNTLLNQIVGGCSCGCNNTNDDETSRTMRALDDERDGDEMRILPVCPCLLRCSCGSSHDDE